MTLLTVKTPSKRYAVLYERGLLAGVGAALDKLGARSGVFVLSSPRVWRHWGPAVSRGLRRAAPVHTVLFDDAERAKSLATVERVCRELKRLGADRRCLIVAVGGGVVGDAAGFVAASYMRGVRLVHVPTTLVAQVDSAVGGKTGVNLPEGKNLVGAFYQPELVLADPLTFATLAAREFRSGLYEVIKYGILGDAKLFTHIERNLAAVLAQDGKQMDWVIPRCIAAKAGIVSRDEREHGLREVLNLGHTFAHALETATAYRKFLHGEAVGWGLMAAAQLAARLRLASSEDAARIATLVKRVGPLPSWPKVAPGKLMQIMAGDKKSRDGRLRLVLPVRIGKVQTGVTAPVRAVRATLEEMAEGSGA